MFCCRLRILAAKFSGPSLKFLFKSALALGSYLQSPPGTLLVNRPCPTFKGYNAAGIQLLALEGDRHFMKKPFGVSASAVFALLGSLLMLGFFVLLGLVLLFSPG